MINREILYERNMTGSYMKIPVNIEGEFDEKILLRKRVRGLLPMERAFMDGSAQYWYNISGKQSLDTYCRMRELSTALIEKLILSICDQIEILEWNLIDTRCLMLDPELIFITSDCKEFIFMVYPGAQGDISREFRQLMDFLITKVDHKDVEAVQSVYILYEKLLNDESTILDVRDIIVQKKKEIAPPPVPKAKPLGLPAEKRIEPVTERKLSKVDEILNRIQEWLQPYIERINNIIKPHVQKEENIVYPTEREEKVVVDYPTVLLSTEGGGIRGVLMYEGVDGLRNIQIEKAETHIGKGKSVDVQIERETISHYHARIEKEDENYYIQDMNSKNGTFVNHQMIAYKEKYLLKKNDLVSFADVEYRFC